MKNHPDVIIVGGGLAGASQALALASLNVSSVVLDAQKPDPQPHLDGRLLAIAYGSEKLLESYGIDIKPLSQPILEIFVSDEGESQILHYDHTLLNLGPMGYMVEIQSLRSLLLEAVQNHPLIEWHAPELVTQTQLLDQGIEVTTKDGNTYKAPLLIGADGKNSPLRTQMGLKTRSWSYDQTAIVCAVNHPINHEGRAFEHFMPRGPFALLPMKGGYQSSIVWSESTRLAPHYLKLSEDEFNLELNQRFQGLGTLSIINDTRWSYPLGAHALKDFTAPRLALVGDAAHGIHPMAGQGLNLGLRDVEDISKRIHRYKNLGLDWGSHTVLQEYQHARRLDHCALIGMTDLMTRAFSNSITPLRKLRGFGLGFVNHISPLKKVLVAKAMGLVS
jgi:2-octaprenyl-6-methoxyphenol hydroxylase